MSFFVRKKTKTLANLSKTVGESNTASTKLKNTDFKPRPKKLGKRRSKVSGGPRSRPHPNFEKKRKLESTEEIESPSSDDELEEEKEEDKDFPINEDDGETAQEKKLRLARLYLEEIEKEERRKREDAEVDEELISARLKEDVLEAEGRLKREVADKVEVDVENITVLTCGKYLKRSVTCLCVSEDDNWIFSGSKDGHIIKWSVQDKKKVGIIKRKERLSKKQKKRGVELKAVSDENSCHSTCITALAISSDGKFLASGDAENQVVIWNPTTLKRIKIFNGHKKPIRGLVFRRKTHTLYSCSDDRTVKIWSLDEMGYVETLFGHQDSVSCIDALTRERALTGGGRDGSLRVWKIVEESQLVYNGHATGNIDCVKLINEENFASCGDDGLLCTWSVNRKKPLCSVEAAHGDFVTAEGSKIPQWLTSIAAWNNTDLIATGSCDGQIRFWKCGEKFKSLTSVFEVSFSGWCNALAFSWGPDVQINGRPKYLVAGIGKEHKLGRWFNNIKEAKNSVVIIPLKTKEKRWKMIEVDSEEVHLNLKL